VPRGIQSDPGAPSVYGGGEKAEASRAPGHSSRRIQCICNGLSYGYQQVGVLLRVRRACPASPGCWLYCRVKDRLVLLPPPSSSHYSLAAS
jgi:hypothetical protein